MNNKTLIKLALLSIFLIALGLFQRESQGPEKVSDAAGAKLLPELADDLNEVSSVTVEHSSGAYTLSMSDGSWGLVERSNYPVRVEDVRKSLIALSDAECQEAKTKVAANYYRLGVEGPGEAESESRLVTLRDSEGQIRSSVIIGKRRESAGQPSFYARVADKETSWLVSGDLSFSNDADSWLDKKILELKRERVRAVQTVHPDGEELFVARPSEEVEQFEVMPLPEGFKLKYDAVAAGMGSALQYLSFVGVQSAEGFELPEEAPTKTSFWTFDGLRVDALIYSVADTPYASFTVVSDSEGPAQLATPGPLPEEEAEAGRSDEEIAAEVAELNAKVSGWVYELAVFNKTNLAKRGSDLLDPIIAEGEGAAAPPLGGTGLPGGLTIPGAPAPK